ncbi:hypothetical protein BDR07DRAFT_1028641 [Suillus spraguei]|nr:hypothetical protein BDR07DRAFT_1028641 [Suillus spraguei]
MASRFSLGSLCIIRLLSVGDGEDHGPAIVPSTHAQPLKGFPLFHHLISRLFAARDQVSNSEIHEKPVAIQPSSATSPYMGHAPSPAGTWVPDRGTWALLASKQVVHPLAGTPVASAFFDSPVGLQQLSDRRTFTISQNSALWTSCIILSTSQRCILSGCQNRIILERVVPKYAFPENLASMVCSS